VNRSTGGITAILVAACLWGTTGTSATFAAGMSPLAIGAAAMGVGGLMQALIAVPALRRSSTTLWANRRLVVLGAASVAVYPLAFYSSMHLAGVAIGTVVSLASAPRAWGVLEHVVEHRRNERGLPSEESNTAAASDAERPSLRGAPQGGRLSGRWVGAALLGVTGSSLLCLTRGGEPGAGQSTLVGIALGLLAGITYAIYSWVIHQLARRDVGRAASMGAVFGLGGALLMPVLLATGQPLIASPASFAVAVYMALIPMFLGYLLFGYGLARIRPSEATTLTLIEPVIAAVLAVVVVGEGLSLVGWVGLTTVGAALVVLVLAPNTGNPDGPRAGEGSEILVAASSITEPGLGVPPDALVRRPPVARHR
jgi:DME family drug/metabolite transporter